MKDSITACAVATVVGVAGAVFEYFMQDPAGIVVGCVLAIVGSFSALVIHEVESLLSSS